MKENTSIKPWMKKNVVSINQKATLKEAAELLAEKRVGTLPVVDDAGRMVGLTTMKEIVSLFLPDFLHLLEDVDFVKDFGAMRHISDEDIERANSMTIGQMMEEPIYIDEACSPVRALSIMETHTLADIPVVKDKVPVGIISRVDIGRAFLDEWFKRS